MKICLTPNFQKHKCFTFWFPRSYVITAFFIVLHNIYMCDRMKNSNACTKKGSSDFIWWLKYLMFEWRSRCPKSWNANSIGFKSGQYRGRYSTKIFFLRTELLWGSVFWCFVNGGIVTFKTWPGRRNPVATNSVIK